MPYDPQRSHRRPQLADDAPAPIDALLSNGADAPESAVETPAAEAPRAEAGRAEPAPAARRDDVTIAREIDVEIVPERGRPRVALIAVALLVIVLVFAWVRRRR